MRGGTANCTVVVSDEEIGSPVVGHPASLIVMNGPSLDKYQPLARAGPTLVLNASLIDPARVGRSDLRLVPVPANEVARDLGSPQLASMVALGAYAVATGVCRWRPWPVACPGWRRSGTSVSSRSTPGPWRPAPPSPAVSRARGPRAPNKTTTS